MQDAKHRTAAADLSKVAESCVKQNNTIDIYQQYFEGDSIDMTAEPPSAKGLAVFRDPNSVKRAATKINWNPDGNKIAVAYSVLNFQDERMMRQRLPAKSYIWDITNPNAPERELVPASPLVCLRYNPKFQDILVGGCYNGLISIFDLKSRNAAVTQPATYTSEVEHSHHDPVYDVFWVQSKTHKEFVSVSTDGRMLKWDMRNFTEPVATYELKDAQGAEMGGCSLEYNVEGGSTKFLVGTEQGLVVSINTKKKGGQMVSVKEAGAGKHHGPIYSLQRNPTHAGKYFMSVGDWSARIWSDDCSTPIFTTPYASSYLTSGCWSPTRPGVFFTTRMDGVLDVWDLFHRQSDVAYTHKIGDVPLTSIAVQGSPQTGGGRLVAVGDSNGTVSLLEVSESLSVSQTDEKLATAAMLDRETERERHLLKRAQEIEKARSKAKGGAGRGTEADDAAMEETLRRVDAEFLAMIKDAEEEDGRAMEGGAAAQ